MKPTIVLVHGAWADASSWKGEIRQLQADGYIVMAPAIPLRSLEGDAAYLRSVLNSLSGPIVLVAHSYGGAVASDAATGDHQVKALVFVDAFVPDEGESVLQLAAKFPGSQLPAAIATVPYSEGAGRDGIDVYIKTADFREAFAADVSPVRAAYMAVTQRPITLSALEQPSSAPAWKGIPSWYMIGTRDHAIPVTTQEFMAARAKSHVVRIAASHASLVSRPEAVTNLIIDAAATAG